MTRYSGPTTRPRRLYTAEQLEAARAAWDAGDFSEEWQPWRQLAAVEAGIIDPPAGTAYDSWGDDSPSQRAILIRAIRETPRALEAALRSPGVHGWAPVVAQLVRRREEISRELARDEARQRRAAAAARQTTLAIPDEDPARWQANAKPSPIGDLLSAIERSTR